MLLRFNDFNSCIHCGMQRHFSTLMCRPTNISIHALPTECNLRTYLNRFRAGYFNSYTPLRSATCSLYQNLSRQQNFNSCAPCRMQLNHKMDLQDRYEFQFMHSLRNATCQKLTTVPNQSFQFIHSLRNATNNQCQTFDMFQFMHSLQFQYMHS